MIYFIIVLLLSVMVLLLSGVSSSKQNKIIVDDPAEIESLKKSIEKKYKRWKKNGGSNPETFYQTYIYPRFKK